MQSKKLLEGPLSEGLAWAQQAACDALDAGKVYEVRKIKEPSGFHIAWVQVDADEPIIGCCTPTRATTFNGYLLGRFIAS